MHMVFQKKIKPDLTFLSPQDEKKETDEKIKKLRREIYLELEDEFYNHANLTRLFSDPTEIQGFAQYLPYISVGVSFITLLIVAFK